MKKQEWLEMIKERLTGCFPKEYPANRIEIVQVLKCNETVLSGISVILEDNSPRPIIYLDDAYEDYLQGRTVEDIVDEITQILLHTDIPDFDLKMIADFNVVKNLLSARICNFSANAHRLSDKLYDVIGDFAKSYCINITQDDSGISTCLIPKAMLNSWQVSMEDVDAASDANLATNAVLYEVQDAVSDMILNSSPSNLLLKTKLESLSGMYILTNTSKIYGATSILSSTIQKKLYALIGSYYILPCSVHELIIIPQSMSDNQVGFYKDVVTEANRTVTSTEEWLSDNIYLFDGSSIKCIA